MDSRLLERLTALPRSSKPDEGQLATLRVLADEWISRGRPMGELLAERLQGEVSTARCEDLGFDPWLSQCDVRALPLVGDELAPLVAEIAARRDFDASVRLLDWLLSAPIGNPLHGLVAETLETMLMQVERRELAVVSSDGGKFRLANGWQMDVFIRVYDFWRIDVMISPQGFQVLLIDYDDGPLSELNEYEPPDDVASEVYGLGLHARRQFR